MKKLSILSICSILITIFFTIASSAENKAANLTTNNSLTKEPSLNLGQDKKQQLISKASDRVVGAVSLIKEINSGMYPIPNYMFNNAKIMIVVSSYKQFGGKSGDEAGRGIAVTRDPKTKQWGAPIFVTIKDGYIRDITETRNINDQFSAAETTMVFFGIHENARNIFYKEEADLGNLAGVLVSSGIFQYRKHTGDSAALSVGLFGYVYSNKLIIGASIENSTVKQDKVLNEAIYETKVVEQFLPAAPFIPKPILACTDMLNQRYSGNK